jgi:predicted molibdopterin-dependent oxidoreductase YjgC
MSEKVSISVNGVHLAVEAGTSVAVAMMIAGAKCRTSVGDESRGPLCGMGICFECRAEIDGVPHRRSCQVVCAPGMNIQTDE